MDPGQTKKGFVGCSVSDAVQFGWFRRHRMITITLLQFSLDFWRKVSQRKFGIVSKYCVKCK